MTVEKRVCGGAADPGETIASLLAPEVNFLSP
jgi:hypothetical protein